MTSDDLREAATQKRLTAVIESEEPDLLVQAPPCGPWSPLQFLNDQEAVFQKQVEHYPLWEVVRRNWDQQHYGGRLNLTEQPRTSLARQLLIMQRRPGVVTAVVDQC